MFKLNNIIIPACLLLALANPMFGQNNANYDINEQINSNVNWSQYDKKIRPAQKDSAINYLFLNSDYCSSRNSGFYDSLQYFSSAHSKNIHLIDIDNDKDQDIIFDGKSCPGVEGGVVDIYLNDKDNYKKVLAESGKAIKVENMNGHFLISIYQYPCCAEIQNTITNFSFNQSLNTFDTISIDFFVTCQVGNGEFIPKKLKPSAKFNCIADSTYLRWKPSNTEKCIHGNRDITLGVVLPKSISGLVLCISPDKEWAFVVLDYDSNISIHGVHSPNTKMKTITKIYGWLPLKEIKCGN